MHHAADVYGCMLVVHGGFSGEEKDILNDFGIYDLSKLNKGEIIVMIMYIEKKTWVKAIISKSNKKMHSRYMHTMTSVYCSNIDTNNKYSRGIWA